MTKRFQGKVAVITGGTTGIGFATARQFVEEGATVILTGQNPVTLEAARAEIGDAVEIVQSDASNEGDIKTLIESVVEKHGKIDVLFLNAGISRFAPWEEQSIEDFDHIFNVNVRGPWLAIKYGIPALKDGASIIITTSTANQSGVAQTSAYAATKAALAQLARTAAVELAPRGIRVNAVRPGPIDTPIFGKTGMSDEGIKKIEQDLVDAVPLGRIGASEEVASVVLFLASKESSYVQGQEWTVDGGLSIT